MGKKETKELLYKLETSDCNYCLCNRCDNRQCADNSCKSCEDKEETNRRTYCSVITEENTK